MRTCPLRRENLTPFKMSLHLLSLMLARNLRKSTPKALWRSSVGELCVVSMTCVIEFQKSQQTNMRCPTRIHVQHTANKGRFCLRICGVSSAYRVYMYMGRHTCTSHLQVTALLVAAKRTWWMLADFKVTIPAKLLNLIPVCTGERSAEQHYS